MSPSLPMNPFLEVYPPPAAAVELSRLGEGYAPSPAQQQQQQQQHNGGDNTRIMIPVL